LEVHLTSQLIVNDGYFDLSFYFYSMGLCVGFQIDHPPSQKFLVQAQMVHVPSWISVEEQTEHVSP
jgi:hypothetical protein